MARCAWLAAPLLLVWAASGCKVVDPLFCNEDKPCMDPALPYCDLTGEFPASEGRARTCIPDPFPDGGLGPDAGDGAPDAGPGPDGALPAALTIDPDEQDFGEVVQGNNSATVTFTVANGGGSPSDALTVEVIGAGAGSFEITAEDCAGAPLAPDATCEIDVRLLGATTGSKSAELEIGAGAETLTVDLSGNVLEPGDLDVNPSSESFGPVALGGMSGETTFTVTNTGGSPTGTITTMLGDATHYVISTNTCAGNPLGAGADCTLGVRFTPQTVGSKTTMLTISATPGDTAIISLSGTGTALLTVGKDGTGGGTVTSSPAGINCGSSCMHAFSASPVTLTATPNGSSAFTGWSGVSCADPVCSVPMTQARTVTATFDFACTANAFQRCEGDSAIFCNGAGTAEVTEACGAPGCNASQGRCNQCVPDSSTCTSDEEFICGSDGLVAETNTCLMGCHSGGTRCYDIDPSNNLSTYLDDAHTGPDLTLTNGTVIDTGQGTVLIGGSTLQSVPNALVPAPTGGVAIRVFMVRSLSVTGNVTVSGAPAVAFVSHEAISIQGHFRIEAGAGPDGHGGNNPSPASTCNPDFCDAGGLTSCAGSGGGGFGGGGGSGGAAGPVAGGSGGAVVGSADLVPLRGGGRGGSSGGAGGGAIQLVSRTSIAVTSGAVYAGGRAATVGIRGGGAGGGIMLEAPTVLVSGQDTALAANGAGGRCFGDVTTEAEDGRLDSQRAAGCASNDGGNGGAGGSAQVSSGSAGVSANTHCSTSPPVGGGGGGGGAGRIRVNTASGSFSPVAGAVVSPAANQGQVSVR